MSCCSETNRLPDTSLAKMSLFKMSKELHFRICNYGKPRASPRRHGKEIDFYSEEKEVGRATVNKESMAFHWLNIFLERRGVFLLSIGFLLSSQWENCPCWSPDSIWLRFLFINFYNTI